MGNDTYKKNIGFIGSVGLLVSCLTAPGIVLIPAVYQDAGWLLPTITFIGIMILTAFAALMIVEASSKFPGNEKFGRNVEFTVLVHRFYGRSWYYVMIIILYGSLASTNVVSIVGSAQVFDNLFIMMFGKTCGLGISPISGLYCVDSSGTGNSPFGDNFMFTTFGMIINFMFIVPLAQFELNKNILPQVVSMMYIAVFTITVIYMSAATGLTNSLPAVTSNQSQILGQTLFNYAMVNIIPSCINIMHPRVDIKRTVWVGLSFGTLCYIIIGIFGSLAFQTNLNINVLQVMYDNEILGILGKSWMRFVYILYPFFTYMASLPVTMIIVRLNLLSSKICNKSWSDFWAIFVPFIVAIPLQTGSLSNRFGIWTSITFQAFCNFIAPFLIFFFLNKRNTAVVQSIMDELEILDINSGIRKVIREDEDNFDYIYHLPHADPSRIVYRDPFKKTVTGLKDEPETSARLERNESISKLSINSRHSIKDIRKTLDPTAGELAPLYRRSVNNSRVSLQNSIPQLARTRSIQGSNANLGTNFESAMRLSSMGGSQFVATSHATGSNQGTSIRLSRASDRHRAVLDVYGGNMATRSRERSTSHSAYRSDTSGKVAPIDDLDDENLLIDTTIYQIAPPFKAVPRWLTDFIRPQWFAGAAFLLMSVLIIDVIVTQIISPST